MKSQKILGLLFLFIFSVSPARADDLSCPPEEPGKIEALVAGINKRLKAGTISRKYCKEMQVCMYGSSSKISDCIKYGSSRTFSSSTAFGNCNLDLQEGYVLTNYMGSLYGCMNRALYSDKPTVYPTLNSSLNSALDRFPAYEGFVFRGSNLPPQVLEKHQVGKTITYPAYTSSSTNPEVARNFGTHQFLIYSKSGRPIMGINGGGSEYEVLFKAGTRFRVLAVKGAHHILREVTGQETESQEKAEDARILQLAQEAKKNFKSDYSLTPDKWGCPLDDKKIPARLMQKTIPDVRRFVE